MAIETIYAMGDDAHQNLFQISFNNIAPFFPQSPETILTRIQNFTIPGTGSDTYEVHYLTQVIEKPSTKINYTKEFSFDIRVDQNWLVYNGFKLWKNAVANSYTGIIGQDNIASNNRTDVTVWPLYPDGTSIPGFNHWAFKGAYVKTLGDVTFDMTVGEPIITNVTFGFLALDDDLLVG